MDQDGDRFGTRPLHGPSDGEIHERIQVYNSLLTMLERDRQLSVNPRGHNHKDQLQGRQQIDSQTRYGRDHHQLWLGCTS